MVFNATFNNITVISWQFVHKGDIITVKRYANTEETQVE